MNAGSTNPPIFAEMPARLGANLKSNLRGNPQDLLGRGLRDLRISITDRCNFRCSYCMPRELFGAEHQFLARRELLSFEEIERLATLFAQLGVSKLRITGGEPLLRRGLEDLLEPLIRIPGINDLSLTTNGSLLTAERAKALAGVGLTRITLSLDALDDRIFRLMNDSDFPVAKVLAAIEHAQDAGLSPVKVNMVVIRGVNEEQILPMAGYFRERGVILRFIEYMDVGGGNGWQMGQVVPAKTIIDTINTQWPLQAQPANYSGEVANRWCYADGAGEVGVIASVTQPFCGGCTRARLSSKGELFTCLFAGQGRDLRDLLRGGASDAQVREVIAGIWGRRSDRYSELRGIGTAQADNDKVNMSYIGG